MNDKKIYLISGKARTGKVRLVKLSKKNMRKEILKFVRFKL